MLFGVSITDWIQSLTAIISLIISVIAIIISVKSLKLTEKSILDANRPYVTMYVETIDTIYFSKDLVIKNFGKTGAKIESLIFDTELDEINKEKNMQSVVGGMIMPNQKFTTAIKNDFNKEIKVHIKYSDLNKKEYMETIVIKTDMMKDLRWSSKANSKDSREATAIKHSTHALLRAFK